MVALLAILSSSDEDEVIMTSCSGIMSNNTKTFDQFLWAWIEKKMKSGKNNSFE